MTEIEQDYSLCPYCGKRGAYIENDVEKCKFCPYLRRRGETFLAHFNPYRPQSIRKGGK